MKIKYGPYPRNDKRQQVEVEVEYSDGTVKSMLYSRHLMEVKIGRRLESWEHVDHHDGNKLNDDISNLKILSSKSNAEKDVVRVQDAYVKCAWCETLFKITSNQRNRRSKTNAGPFCGRSCSGKYGRAIQMGTIEKVDRTEFKLTYYKQSGAALSEEQSKYLDT